MGGDLGSGGINGVGLTGTSFLVVDRSGGSTNNNIYMLASVIPPGRNTTDVMFARSTDGGLTFSAPHKINDDPVNPSKWHSFGTLSVAPNGRLDAVWYDTRNAANNTDSQLFYSWSTDAGVTWAPNVAVSSAFNPSGRLSRQPKQDRRLHNHSVRQYRRQCGVFGHVQLQPEPEPARRRRLLCARISIRRGHTHTDTYS